MRVGWVEWRFNVPLETNSPLISEALVQPIFASLDRTAVKRRSERMVGIRLVGEYGWWCERDNSKSSPVYNTPRVVTRSTVWGRQLGPSSYGDRSTDGSGRAGCVGDVFSRSAQVENARSTASPSSWATLNNSATHSRYVHTAPSAAPHVPSCCNMLYIRQHDVGQ